MPAHCSLPRRLACFLVLALSLMPPATHATPVRPRADMQATDQRAATAPHTASSAEPALELVGSFGGSFSTMAISGTLAYIGEGAGLMVLDISNPALPVRLARIPVPGVAMIQLTGTTLYLIGGDQLRIVDVRAPSSPVLLGSYGLPRHPTALQVVGSDAYITYTFNPFPNPSTHGQGGVAIIDVSDPAHPRQRGGYAPLIDAAGVAVANGFAYVTDHSGVDIVDVRQPDHPTLRGNAPLPNGYDNATAIQVVGTQAYVVFTRSLIRSTFPTLSILDISDSVHPVVRGTWAIPGSYLGNFQVVDGLAYISYASGAPVCPCFRVDIVDVHIPGSPTVRGTYNSAGLAHVVVAQNRVHLLTSDKLEILDRASNNTLTLRGSYALSYPALSALSVRGTTAYIVESQRLRLLDVSDPTHPSLLGSAPTAINGILGTGALHVDGQHVYVSDDGLKIFNVTNPLSPALQSSYPLSSTTALYVAGNMAYLLGDGQLTILDVGDPALPTPRGIYSGFAYGYDIQVAGNLAYVAADSKLHILDVSNPSSPALRGTYTQFNSLITTVDVQGNLAYCTEGNGLSIINISNPAAPTLRGRYETPALVTDIRANGGLAYLATSDYAGTDGVRVLDISNPASVLLRGSFPTHGGIPQLQIVGDLIYVNARTSGMEIWRIHPERLASPVFLPTLL